MNESPFIGIIKIAAFLVLSLLVLLVFWQRTELEDKITDLSKRTSTMEEAVSRASSEVKRLKDRVSTGGGGIRSGDGGPEASHSNNPLDHAWKKQPPHWVTGRAAELWGKFGDNFLTADPDQVALPSLDDPTLDPRGDVRYHYGSNIPHTNVFTMNESSFTRRIRSYCNHTWAEPHVKDGYAFAPALAYRVEHSPDRKQWVFWIRPDVRWHTPAVDLKKYPHLAGEHFLTARDWAFTMACVMDDRVNVASIRAYFEGFDRVEVIDDHCFIMHWKKPTYTAISANLNIFQPVPEFVYGYDETGRRIEEATRGQQINNHWFGAEYYYVGTGPYSVREFRKEDVVILDRFEEHFAAEKPPIRRHVMPIIDAVSTAQAKFEAGEFAFAGYRLPQFKKRVQSLDAWKSGKLAATDVWGSSYLYIGYKNSHRIFKDPRVRRAMTHACDRERLLGLLNEGEGKVITGPSYWRAPTAPKDIVPLAFDLDKARALLEEAGWQDSDGNGILDKQIEGERVEFSVTAKIPSGSALYLTIFDVFSQDLLKIGVKIDTQTLQWAQYLKEVAEDRNFEVCCLGWDTSGWDNDFTQIWHSKQIPEPKSSNHIEFKDEKVDELIERAKLTFDSEERVKVQGAIHRRINELQPYTFLFTFKSKLVWWKDQVSDLRPATVWLTRPFVRLWPIAIPKGK